MRNIPSNLKSIDGKLSIRIDPICICEMILCVPDVTSEHGEYTLNVHCDNAECSEKHINKIIVLILE